jgi:hypothetical protein
MGTLQQIGGKINSTREVELNTLAARAVVRPFDALRGSYVSNTTMSATGSAYTATVTNNPIFGLQWVSDSTLLLVKNITISVSTLGNATGAGSVIIIRAFRAYPFLQQFDLYTGDNVTNVWKTSAQTLAIGSGNKLRNTMLGSDAGGVMYSDIDNITVPTGGGGASVGTTLPGSTIVTPINTSGAPLNLSGGTFTLETNPFASLVTGVIAASVTNITPRFNPSCVLFDIQDYGHPLVFENMSGLVINHSVPIGQAGGISFQLSISMEWDESPAY